MMNSVITHASLHLPDLALVLLRLGFRTNAKHRLLHRADLLLVRYQSLLALEFGIVQNDDVAYANIVVPLVLGGSLLFPDQGSKAGIRVDACVG